MSKNWFRFSFIAMLLLALVLVGCTGGSGGGGGVQKAQLEGKIFKDGTETLVTTSVVVKIDGKTMTVTDGQYQFTSVSVGNKTLTAQAEGYKSFSEPITISASKNTKDIFLKEGSDPDPDPELIIEMALVPRVEKFPIGVDDDSVSSSVKDPYLMAKYEVTYELWREVYEWATSGERGIGKYLFQNSGAEGSDGTPGVPPTNSQQPVTGISWRDAMVWCNALTEYHNFKEGTSLDCVYIYNGNIVRDSTNDNANTCDNVTQTPRNGFRLPTSMEWELAARWRDDDTNTVDGYLNPYFTKGNSASGANNFREVATKPVAWYEGNSDFTTHPVGQKTPNALGIYDMSGNVAEWCFDKVVFGADYHRVLRGGHYLYNPDHLQVGYESKAQVNTTAGIFGFRPVRTQ